MRRCRRRRKEERFEACGGPRKRLCAPQHDKAFEARLQTLFLILRLWP